MTADTIRELLKGLDRLEANPQQSARVREFCKLMRARLEAYVKARGGES